MASDTTSLLIYAVRARVLLKYGGQLALVLAVLTLAPLAISMAEHEWVLFFRYAVICAGLFVTGGLAARLSAPEHIQDNEALTLTALAFLCSPLLMAWPMMAAGVSFSDAFFEAVSGVTTTGLTTMGSIEGRSAGFLFTRAWMQWYGGLGIVVFSVAILTRHQAAARRLVEPAETGETLMATARTHARRSFIVYAWLTLFGLAAVWPLQGDVFTSLLHVLSAVSTGGFSGFDASLGNMSRPAAIAVMALSFMGAVSLPLYWRVAHAGWRKGLRTLLGDVELRALLLACLLLGALLSALASQHDSAAPWYHGLMMGFSAQTTTGFSTLAVAGMDPTSKLLMIVSMLVGGSVGSSAGGFKLLRLLILLRLLQLMIRRAAMPPHAVAEPSLGGHRLRDEDLLRALQLILLFIGIAVLSWLPFVMLGYAPLDALFEVVSACGTVGLSSGIARPELEPLLKGVLCFDMLTGRVEIIAMLVVLYPHNWFGRREENP
jgi:trk system potassium uptake protein TrkH